MSTVNRIYAYVAQRTNRRGLDSDVIHGLDAGCATEAKLTLTDLRELLADNARLRDDLVAATLAAQSPTLRDQFAMAALTGLTNYSGGGYYVDERAKTLFPKLQAHVALAYAFADAMLLAREAK